MITENTGATPNLEERIQDPLEIGRYKVQRRLGQGAMGLVYLAFDPSLMRLVAIKIMRDARGDNTQVQARFQREAVVSARLNHPHIITIFDVGNDPACGPFMAMEYVDGASLAELIKEGLPLETGLRVLLQIVGALSASEAAGIAHRDIKPNNILVSRDWRAKLMDFGIAQADETRLTQEGLIIGTPLYTAPEVLTGAEASPISDRYSFAVTAFETITGTLPYQAKSVGTLVYRIVHGEPDFPETLSTSLRQVFQKALAKRPENRYQDSFQMLEAVLQAVELADETRQRLLSLLNQIRATAKQAPMDERTLAAARATTQILAPTVMFDSDEHISEELDLQEGNADTDQTRLLPTTAATPSLTSDQTTTSAEILEPAMPTMIMPVVPPLPEARPVQIEAPSEAEVKPVTLVLPQLNPEPEPFPEHAMHTMVLPILEPSPDQDEAPSMPEVQAATMVVPRMDIEPEPLPEHAMHTMVLPVLEPTPEPVQATPEVMAEPEPLQAATMILPQVDPKPAMPMQPAEPIPESPIPTMVLPPLEPEAAPAPTPATSPAPAPQESLQAAKASTPEPRKSRLGLMLTAATVLLVAGAAAWVLAPRFRSKPVPVVCTLASLTTNPDGAIVYLDGKRIGEAPIHGLSYAGEGHQLRIEREGFQPEVRHLDPHDASLHVMLKPMGTPVAIHTDPAGTEVFIDGKSVGRTPLDAVVIPTSGTHEITIKADGYAEWTTTFDPDLPLPDPIVLNPLVHRRRR